MFLFENFRKNAIIGFYGQWHGNHAEEILKKMIWERPSGGKGKAFPF